MEVRAIHKSARISPLKARDVAREIQGLRVSHALDILNFTPRKAAFLIGKTLKSAVANAENNHGLNVDALVVKEATATDGPSFRRFKPRARGSASAIKKRTSHLTVVLSDEVVVDDRQTRAEATKAEKRARKRAKKKAAAATPEPAAEETASEE